MVAWAGHVVRIRKMTYLQALIWKFALKGQVGIILRRRWVGDIVMDRRVTGLRSVDCNQLADLCGCSNAGNVISLASCLNFSRKRLHRRPNKEDRALCCEYPVDTSAYLPLPVAHVKRRCRFRSVNLTNPLQKWHAKRFVAAWDLETVKVMSSVLDDQKILFSRGLVCLCVPMITKQQNNPITGLDRPLGCQEVEASRFLDNRHMKVVRLSALRTGRLYPPGNIPGTHFC
jgi:hypothetical protein